MRHTVLLVSVIVAATVLMPAPRSAPVAPTTAQSDKIRIGTYDNRAVALAYARKDGMGKIKALFDRAKQAEKAGDTKLLERLRQAGDRRQWMSHRQVFGRESVREYLVDHQRDLEGVAKVAGVTMIVWEPDYFDKNVYEIVDVTDAVVDIFQPDDNTKKTIAELLRHEPADIGDDFSD
ncbi:MAG: hypothetical protein QM770_12940 [Tepidisphaeraceae bacterium]